MDFLFKKCKNSYEWLWSYFDPLFQTLPQLKAHQQPANKNIVYDLLFVWSSPLTVLVLVRENTVVKWCSATYWFLSHWLDIRSAGYTRVCIMITYRSEIVKKKICFIHLSRNTCKFISESLDMVWPHYHTHEYNDAVCKYCSSLLQTPMMVNVQFGIFLFM